MPITSLADIASPAFGQVEVVNGKTYTFDGYGWVLQIGDVTTSGAQRLVNKTMVNPASGNQILTDQAVILWDADLGQSAEVTLGGNRTIQLPSHLKNGNYILVVKQDTTAGRTLTFATGYNFQTAPVQSTQANGLDVYQFVSDGVRMYGQQVFKGTAPPAPAPTPAPPPAGTPQTMNALESGRDTLSASGIVITGQDPQVSAIFTSGAVGSWWYPATGADRFASPAGAAPANFSGNGSAFGYLKDHAANAYPLSWANDPTNGPIYFAGPPVSMGIYSHPQSIAGLGGSTTGFLALMAFRLDSGTFNTLLSDVVGAASGSNPSVNGRYLRFDGETGKLTFSVGTGSTRVAVDVPMIAGQGAASHVAMVWHDMVEGTINLQVDGGTVVSKTCTTHAAGSSSLQVFSNPFADFSFPNTWEGWDHLYGLFYGGFVFKNTCLDASKRAILLAWTANQAGISLQTAATPAPTPAPPAPAPIPAGASTATFAQPASVTSITSKGAVAGGPNCLSAIQSAIDAAASTVSKIAWIPPGEWHWSGGLIHVHSGVKLMGAGYTNSTLYGDDYLGCAIFLEGDSSAVQQLKLAGQPAPGRESAWSRTRITVMGATNFTIKDCWLEGAPAAGISLARSSGATGTVPSGGYIGFNTIKNTLADSIHFTNGATNCVVESNQIENSGDDGIAVVSYDYDATPVTFITARNNVVLNNMSGRNMSVVGGEDIYYYNNYLEGNSHDNAGVYIAQEGSYSSRPCKRVKVELNTIKNCGGLSTSHAQIMLFSDGTYSGVPNDDIWLLRNDLISSGSKASVNGIRYYGPQTNVKLDQNRYTGGGSASVSTAPGTTIATNVAYSSGAVGYSQPVTTPPAPPPPPPPPAGQNYTTYTAPLTVAPTIPTPAAHRHDLLQAGSSSYAYWIEDNRWGERGIPEGTGTGQYTQGVERSTTVGPNGEVAYRFKWNWPMTVGGVDTASGSFSEVKGFPAAIYGAKPGYAADAQWPAWDFALRLPDGATVPTPPSGTPTNISSSWVAAGGSVSTVSPSGMTAGSLLPMAVPMNPLVATFKWKHASTPTGVGHLTFDIWLQSDPVQSRNGFFRSPITHEIMVGVCNWGNYGTSHLQSTGKWSKDPSWYHGDAVIGGVLYHVYCYKDRPGAPGLQYNFPPGGGALAGNYTNEETGQPRTGWKFIVFTPDLPMANDANGIQHVDIAGIINYCRNQVDSRGTPWIAGQRYCVSAELGVEMVQGAGDITVYDYRLNSTDITASPAPTPAPSPAPAPAPGFPSQVLGCYFTAWDTSYNIKQVPLDFNVIYLFNARPNSDGTFRWDWTGYPSAADIQTCRGRGQKVILTLGGSGFAFPFSNRTQSTNCVNSVKTIISAMGGLDGVDFNTYEGTTATSSTELRWIAQQFKAAYGSDFAITSPPQPNSAEDRALLKVLADAGVLTYAAPQYYDWSGFNDPGFISNRTKDWVASLGQQQVVLGLSANYSNGPSLADCIREYDAVKSMYPSIRGAMCWNAQTNIAGGNVWGSTMRSHIGNALAGASAPPPPPPPPSGGSYIGAQPTAAPWMPFGSRLATAATNFQYPYGIQPTSYTMQQMDDMVKGCYNQWKGSRLKSGNAYIAGTYYDDFGTNAGCVSEGIGYAMLIMVLMAGYEANARTYFDGLLKLARARPAYSMSSTANANKYLMDWKLDSTLASIGGGFSANDGDMDIAMALLMADKQWGSTGTWNYKQEAINTINAMKAVNFASTGEMLMPQNVSRTSDYMIGHFRAYKKATGDSFWDTARTRSQTLITSIINNYSPVAKLQPGFIYQPGTNPQPDTVKRVDQSGFEDIYDANAVRNPWRWGTDYIFSGDAYWGGRAADNARWIKNESGSDPFNTGGMYNLNGSWRSGTGRWINQGMNGPNMVGAMCDSSMQSWLNTLFAALVNNFKPQEYYTAELHMIPLIVASGNWWNP